MQTTIMMLLSETLACRDYEFPRTHVHIPIRYQSHDNKRISKAQKKNEKKK